MATAGTVPGKHRYQELENPELPQAKRIKFSDLPLSSAQKSAIDGLVHTIKKKGIYDTLRKKVWSQFDESVSLSKSYSTSPLSHTDTQYGICRPRKPPSSTPSTNSQMSKSIKTLHCYLEIVAKLPPCSKELLTAAMSTRVLSDRCRPSLPRTRATWNQRLERSGVLKWAKR